MQQVNNRRSPNAIAIIGSKPPVGGLNNQIAIGRGEDGGCGIGAEIAKNLYGLAP